LDKTPLDDLKVDDFEEGDRIAQYATTMNPITMKEQLPAGITQAPSRVTPRNPMQSPMEKKSEELDYIIETVNHSKCYSMYPSFFDNRDENVPQGCR
jgi:hypothetical protein